MTWKPIVEKQSASGDQVHVINHFIEGLTLEQYRKQLYGHFSHEGFTLVTMTYHRNERLLQFLASFEACPYLAKVVVVWNNEEDPPSNMTWPDIGVPVEVRCVYACMYCVSVHVCVCDCVCVMFQGMLWSPFLHTVRDQKVDGRKAWERLQQTICVYNMQGMK